MRSLSSSVVIFVGMLVLWAVPARGQIVSYKDSDGKRVFINAEPVAPVRTAKIPLLKTAANGMTLSTPQTSFAESPEMSVAQQVNREKIEEMIREVSARYRVDPALVRAVMQTESNWNSSAVSRKGALGLMQLVPGTAQQLGVNNAFDPKQNLDGGVHYLHMLLERYNGDLDKALAAYNAGPSAVDRAGGIPRYRETRDYVQKVTDSYFRPGSDRLPRAFDERRPIYRAVEAGGRVVFTNE
jgi:soluble lytic murein transglycosylase-like protein